MRLAAFFLLIFCLQVTAEGLSQKVTLSLHQASLSKVFDAITKQTGISIVYNEEVLKGASTVSVDVKDVSVEQLIALCLKGQPLKFEIEGRSVYIRGAGPVRPADARGADTAAVKKTGSVVKGRVKNDKGEPLPGVSVTVKETGHTVVTDAKGDFEIRDVPDDATIVVTSVGMQSQEIKVKGRTQLTVVMRIKPTSLEETVVTAFGVEKSTKELGYSTATVKGEELTRANTGNILNGLTARVSGLNISTQSPDMSPQMQVLLRGIRSFSATSNNQPLFILNGSPLSFGSDQASASLILDFINNINPNDVDKVTILKGANATALYGPEGVNGVIIITTKKGQKGKPVINFRNSVNFQRIDYRAVKYEQRQFGSGTGLVDGNGAGIYSPTINNGWGPKYDGSKVPLGRADENGNYQIVTYSDKKDNRRFFNVATTTQSNLTISQGDEVSNFYLGLGYNTQKGLLPGDNRNTLTMFLSGGRKMGLFDVQYRVNYFRELSNVGPEGFEPNGPTFVPFLQYKDYKNYEWADNNHYWSDADVMSPYQAIAIDRKLGTQNSGIIGLSITTKPLPWITIKDDPGFILQSKYEKHYTEPVYFSDWAKQNGGFSRAFDRAATLTELNQTIVTANNNVTIMAINKAGNFDFRNMIGNDLVEIRNKQVSGSSNALAIPVYNLQYSSQVPYAGEIYILQRRYSFFATSTTAYKQRAFLELTARNDWDSKRAAVGRGKDLYVGGNLSVLMPEILPSLKRLSWLSWLQLRTAVTTTANMNILPYQSERTLQSASADGFPYANGNGGLVGFSYLPGNPNPNLKPEKVLSIESGFLARLWQDKVSLNFSWYWQHNNGVITESAVSWMSGSPSIDNLGILNNTGYEVDLNLNSIVNTRGGFSMSAGFRVAMNQNRVKWLSPDYGGIYPVQAPGGKYGFMGIVARQGKQAFEYWLYDFQKDAQGKTVVDPVTGYPIPDLQTAVYKGTTTSKYTGGFNINLSYRRFSLSTLNEFNIGGQHYFSRGENMTRGGLSALTTYNDRVPYIYPNSVYLDAAGKSIPNTTLKTQDANSFLYNNVAYSTVHFLTNADFLKMKELVLNYEQVFKTRSIKKLNIGIYGRNLFNLYAKNNIYGDPQLVKGPGRSASSTFANQNGSAAGQGNVAGSGSDGVTPAGVVEYGIILTAHF
jgi:TonB-linked SusC/RagA family outer membrane protein